MPSSPSIPATQPPFREQDQLVSARDGFQAGTAGYTIPSQPLLSTAPRQPVVDFLRRDMVPMKLNRLAPHLWMCSQPSYTNIPALHLHTIHGRAVIVAEEPDLHLVWSNGRIFMKPLPAYLLSHPFWTQFLLGDNSQDIEDVRASALGLLRSYALCIQHESDLRMAHEHHLIPPDVTLRQWCTFAKSFNTITDEEVSPRYHYGKIQLTRLHWLVRVCMGELNYYYIDGGYGESFARYYGPLLFVFGILSVVLSAFQVGMAVEQLHSLEWTVFWSASRWFSIVSLSVSAFVALYLVVSFVVKSLDEMLWAARAQFRARLRLKRNIA